MDSIKIISTVEEDGKLRLPPELKLEKGKVRVVIGSLRREDIYGIDGR